MIEQLFLLVAAATTLSLRTAAGPTIPISTEVHTSIPSLSEEKSDRIDAAWNIHLEAEAVVSVDSRWRLTTGVAIQPTIRRERNLEAAGFQTIPFHLGAEVVAWSHKDSRLAPWGKVGWTFPQATIESTRNADLAAGTFYGAGISLERSFARTSVGITSSNVSETIDGPRGKQINRWNLGRILFTVGMQWP
ncbi:MAG: hypothetical protein H6686_10205 [Fibrobacteria bacterium]|nr:hypothetical protein [Fibrobacteria bacterium]